MIVGALDSHDASPADDTDPYWRAWFDHYRDLYHGPPEYERDTGDYADATPWPERAA